ncbi:MAG: DNA starvation/stationary phase protection protein Dps [Armatimonadaceae bacterium]
MHRTKIDLPEMMRLKLASYLNSRLADCLDLGTQAEFAHWNVKGPHFRHLHELFDDLAEDIEEYADLIAERLVQLGGTAHGTARQIAAGSSLREYPHNAVSGVQHIEAMSVALAEFARSAREAITHTTELGDVDAADIFTEISRGVDKWLWIVESHALTSE